MAGGWKNCFHKKAMRNTTCLNSIFLNINTRPLLLLRITHVVDSEVVDLSCNVSHKKKKQLLAILVWLVRRFSYCYCYPDAEYKIFCIIIMIKVMTFVSIVGVHRRENNL